MSIHYPRVAITSLWRNDEKRDLWKRARHLTSKTYGRLRWIWIVGDSDDNTYPALLDYASVEGYLIGQDIQIIEHRTGIVGDSHRSRLGRLSGSHDLAFQQLRPDDDYVLQHESDLVSAPDVVERLLATGHDCVAGLTWLGDLFYDVWGFRAKGKRFSNTPPYHEVYRPDAPFEVESFGSCWLVPALPFVGSDRIRITAGAAREACAKLRERGYSLWADPTVRVEQPRHLWEAHDLTEEQVDEEYWR